MQARWLVNGRDTGVAATDRGLAYGDGLFETIAIEGGRARWIDLHFERLRAGCERLAIPSPDTSQLLADIERLAPPERCVVKIIVTRGSGARGYRPPDVAEPTRIVGVAPWPAHPRDHYDAGVKLAVCRTRVGESPSLAGLKHLGRLEQVLGQAELAASDTAEGLMLTTSEFVIGGTMSNVFCLEGGVLFTPRLDRAGVRGVMRRIVMDRARGLGIPVAEEDLTIARLTSADEVFVTNAIFGVWPVVGIGDKKVASGELARRLIDVIGIGDRD